MMFKYTEHEHTINEADMDGLSAFYNQDWI